MAQLQAIGLTNDNISSLSILEGYKVVLYQDDNFTGGSIELTSNSTCFNSTWNDKVTSLRVSTNGVTNVAGTYYLQNRNSALNMDVWGFSTADGANIAQGIPNNGTNQQFKLAHLGDGTYTVTAVHSGKVLDIDAIKTTNGANAQQWTYFGSWNQQYIVFPTDLNGCFKLIAKHSGKVIEVSNASTANGANVQQWDNNNQTCGQWKFVPLTNTPPPVNQAPSVSLTSPTNNATFNAPASITINANSSDADGNVTKVEFYNGATKIGEDASAPYSFTWSNITAGTYSISAKTFDNLGASTTSSAVNVKVNTVVVNDICSGLPAYVENGGYLAGSKVKSAGRIYECKEYPYSGWCNGAAWAYGAGIGAYSSDAWYDRGACNARTAADINDVSAATESFSISPNPVQDELNINSSYSLSGATVTIIDVTGKTVYQSGASESLSTSNLDAGIYTIIFISSDNNKISKRFIKIK